MWSVLREEFRGGKKVLLFEAFMERRREERKGRRVKRKEETIHV